RSEDDSSVRDGASVDFVTFRIHAKPTAEDMSIRRAEKRLDGNQAGALQSASPVQIILALSYNEFMEERLHKILAHAGVGSRRKCEALIAAGRVSVDGQAVRELGRKLEADQHEIRVDGEPIHTERPVYWLV